MERGSGGGGTAVEPVAERGSGGGGTAVEPVAPQPEQQQPQQQQQPVAQGPQDCMQCRVIGASVCAAASAYLAVQNYAQPATGRVHRAVMLAAAGGFLALGVARALL